jgi:hypothetical protein
MSLFSKLFGKSNGNMAADNNNSSTTSTEDNVNVLEDLFVNNNPPAQEQDVDKSAGLKTWLEQDFSGRGYADGYESHNAERLEQNLKSIKADFRYNICLKIDAARQSAVNLENYKIDSDGMSDRLVKKIENQVGAIKANITELEAEIALSTLDEGLVMIAIHQYRNAFIRGTEDYQEEKFIASSTGMFK